MTDDFIDAEIPTRLLAEGVLSAATHALPPPRRTHTMTDQFLLRMTEAIVKPLSDTVSDGNSPCMEMIPSYNAILSTAKANHPDDPFLSLLPPIEKNGFINVGQLLALFAQLRIVLESLQVSPQC